tara:strand:- start:472 stop:1893 length:1422 start_codon:yes stop_codon:yes gene_type:complete
MQLKKILSEIKIDADWIGLREVNEKTSYRVIRDMKPQANQSNESHGIMVEVLSNGQFAYFGSNSMDIKSIQHAAEKALEQAKIAAKYSIHPFTNEARPKAIGEYQSSYKEGIDLMRIGELNELLIDSNKALKVSDKIVSVSSYGIVTDTEFNYVCSNGSEVNQKFLIVNSDFSATAQDGNIFQRRTGGRSGHQIGMEVFDRDNIINLCNKIGEEAIELLSAEDCPTGTMDLVLDSDQMMLQIHESIGHAIEIDRILGDERNYAGWSFVKLEDFGNLKYGSDIMNVTFDPTVKNELASYAFDDGGMEAKREYIIKNGVLVRGLGAMESQIRSSVPGVANFRASSWNRAPIDRMANLNLEPGESTFDEIISSVDKGIFMKTNRSWSIDDYRNKFQFGCEYGQLIENGKLTKTVKNPNYRAISTPFWNSLKMVGDKSTFGIHGTPNCGKGEPNQVIRVGHASPICLFDNIEVFGGV